jgi:hypothetical protein
MGFQDVLKPFPSNQTTRHLSSFQLRQIAVSSSFWYRPSASNISNRQIRLGARICSAWSKSKSVGVEAELSR